MNAFRKIDTTETALLARKQRLETAMAIVRSTLANVSSGFGLSNLKADEQQTPSDAECAHSRHRAALAGDRKLLDANPAEESAILRSLAAWARCTFPELSVASSTVWANPAPHVT